MEFKQISHKKRSLQIVVLCFYLVALIACTAKKRETHLSQGEGQNLLSVADYDGKTFKLMTKEPVGQSLNISSAKKDQIKMTSEQNIILQFPVVTYETEAKLLKEIPLKAKPHNSTDYEIQYQLSDNYLKVYKVADRKNIPFDEQTYAETLADGRMAIPLIGYPIKEYVKTDRLKNEDLENTNIIKEFRVDSKSEAQFFRIDLGKSEIFEALQKTNTLPASFFEGTWFFSETVVSAPTGQGEDIGVNYAMDNHFKAASKIKFIKDESQLKIVNLDVDERLNTSNENNLKMAMKIPVKWIDFKLKKMGQDTQMNEQIDDSKHWSDRRYLQMDFSQVISTLKGQESGQLSDIEISDHFLSFSIQNDQIQRKIKYSFLKESKNNYTPKIAFREDMKLFGLFYNRRATVLNEEYKKDSDLDRRTFINRFNPDKSEIVYYYSTASRPCSQEESQNKICPRMAIESSFHIWNQSFEKLGLKMRLKIDTSKSVELGDIRYNVINMMDDVRGLSYLGMAPSTSDPSTGETISAILNVSVDTTREIYAEYISNYLRQELGLLDENYYFSNSQLKNLVSMNFIGQIANSSQSQRKNQAKVSQKSEAAKDSINTTQSAESGNKFLKNKFNPLRNSAKKISEYNFAISAGNLVHQIKTTCPEVQAYLEEIKNNKSKSSVSESSIVRQCSQKISYQSLVYTTLHELGHNLGLSHNFAGSSDYKNYDVDSSNKVISKTSSVMDYLSADEFLPSAPGSYDVAALRFAYGDAVETQQNEIKKINPSLSIKENAKKENLALKSYRFCNDEQALLTSEDPFCRLFDSGSTPVEIITHFIQDFNTSSATLNHRYDRINMSRPESLQDWKISYYFIPMKSFYDEWRAALARKLAPTGQLLENLSAAQYQKLLSSMEKDPDFSYAIKYYKPAADLIFDFLTRLALLPAKTCLVQKNHQELNLLDLETLLEIQRTTQRVDLEKLSCDEPNVLAYIKSQGWDLVTELGHFSSNMQTQINSENPERWDVIGSEMDRSLAITMLTSRYTPSKINQDFKFMAALLDEPTYRELWLKKLKDRIILGLDPKVIFENPKVKSYLSQHPNINRAAAEKNLGLQFKREKNLLNGALYSTILELVPPDKWSLSQKFLYPFLGMKTQQTPDIKNKSQSYLGYNLIYVPNEYASFALDIVNKYNEIRKLRNFSRITAEDIQVVMDIYKLLPSKNNPKILYSDLLKSQQEIELGLKKLTDIQLKIAAPFRDQLSNSYEQIFQVILQTKKEEWIKQIPASLGAKIKDNIDLTEAEVSETKKQIENIYSETDLSQMIHDYKLSVFQEDALATINTDLENKKAEGQTFKDFYTIHEEEIEAQMEIFAEFMTISDYISRTAGFVK